MGQYAFMDSASPRPPAWTAIALAVTHLLYVACLLPWLLFLALAVMALDEPDATRRVVPWLVLAFVGAYPVAVLVAIIAGWRAYRGGRIPRSVRWSVVPLLWLVPMAGVFVWANWR